MARAKIEFSFLNCNLMASGHAGYSLRRCLRNGRSLLSFWFCYRSRSPPATCSWACTRVPCGQAIDQSDQPDVDFRGPIHLVTPAFVLGPLGRDEASPNHSQLDDVCAHDAALTSKGLRRSGDHPRTWLDNRLTATTSATTGTPWPSDRPSSKPILGRSTTSAGRRPNPSGLSTINPMSRRHCQGDRAVRNTANPLQSTDRSAAGLIGFTTGRRAVSVRREFGLFRQSVSQVPKRPTTDVRLPGQSKAHAAASAFRAASDRRPPPSRAYILPPSPTGPLLETLQSPSPTNPRLRCNLKCGRLPCLLTYSLLQQEARIVHAPAHFHSHFPASHSALNREES
jgi:hypothetical protein